MSSRPSLTKPRARLGVACWAALVASAPWAAAHGAGAPRNARRVVVWAEGPDAKTASADVTAGLGDGFEVLDPATWHDAMTKAGQHGPLSGALHDPRRRAALLERTQRVASTLQIDDVVLVSTSRTRPGARVADCYVVDESWGSSEAIHVSSSVGNVSIVDAVREQLDLLHPQETPGDTATAPTTSPPEVSSGPPTAAERPEGTAADEAPGGAWRPVHLVAREWFEVAVAGGIGARNFEYHDGFTNNLRDYRLGAAPVSALEGSLYPFANDRTPILRDIGVVGSYSGAVALQSSSTDAGVVGTHWTRWEAGGRLRLHPGGDSAPLVVLSGSYGNESFLFDSSSAAAAFPSVSYDFVRAGVDVRVPLGRFALTAGGAYLGVLSSGDVASRFPHASVGGLDADLGGAFDWGWGIETRLAANYSRFFYAMNSTPGDTFVAGGALDEMWGAQLSVAYVY